METHKLKNKRILITGINGFIGTHLKKRLVDLGADVYGISRSTSGDDKVLKADLLDFQTVDQFIKDTRIEMCFHLASESLVEHGQIRPQETFKTNIDGAVNIFESARRNNMERLIVSSTSHVYGANKTPYLETYMPKPTRPYETSKACVDLIAESYAKTYNLSVLIPRFVNIYGPGDLNFQRIIPKTIKSVLQDSYVEMWGGEIERDYLFIDDAIEAYIKLAQVDMKNVEDSTIFNFGSSNVTTVENLVKKIMEISGKNLEIKKIGELRVGEIQKQFLSYAKATKILGWEPCTNLDDGLRTTIAWYNKFILKLGKNI